MNTQMSSDSWKFGEIFHVVDGVQGWKQLLIIEEFYGKLKKQTSILPRFL